MIKIPQFRSPPTPVHIRLDSVCDGLFSHELGIVFTVSDKQHTGWVPKESVSTELQMIQGAIIADLEDGGWLVGLPVSSIMFSGERFTVNGSEKGRLIDCYLEEDLCG